MKIKPSTIRMAGYAAITIAFVAIIWVLERARSANQDPARLPLQLRASARGPSRPHEYAPSDVVRVTGFAPARLRDARQPSPSASTWIVIGPDSLLMAVKTRIDRDNIWITVRADKELPGPRIAAGTLRPTDEAEIHSTFLEPWQPEVVDGMLEVVSCKLISSEFMGGHGSIVRGYLRNISDAELKQCVVIATFYAKDGKTVLADQKTDPISLRPGQVVQFTTPMTRATPAALELRVQFNDGHGQTRESQPIPLGPAPPLY